MTAVLAVIVLSSIGLGPLGNQFAIARQAEEPGGFVARVRNLLLPQPAVIVELTATPPSIPPDVLIPLTPPADDSANQLAAQALAVTTSAIHSGTQAAHDAINNVASLTATLPITNRVILTATVTPAPTPIASATLSTIPTLAVLATDRNTVNDETVTSTASITVTTAVTTAVTQTVPLPPTATHTLTPRPLVANTLKPTATHTPLPTATYTPKPSATATYTPLPTTTDTPIPTASYTVAPTATDIPAPTATDTPTPTATDTPEPTATPTPIAGAIEPITPGDGEGGGGQRTFGWVANFTPSEGYAFELVFWKPGQDLMTQSIGLAAPTSDLNVILDLERLDEQLGELFDTGEYEWGVLLVRTTPTYERVKYLGGGRRFTYYRHSDSGSGGQSSGE